jgi:hypothetical protein
VIIEQHRDFSTFNLLSREHFTMAPMLKALNLIASSASGLAAVIALMKPESLSGSSHVERGEIFYTRMYAARFILLGVAFGLLPFYFREPAVAWFLFTASAIQFADVAIAVGKKDKGMAFGATTGATLHLLCGLSMLLFGWLVVV